MPKLPEPLLTVKEVASVYRVEPRTIQRWAKTGRLKVVVTPGGRLRRFRSADVEALLQGDDQPAPIDEVRTPEHIATAVGNAITSAASTPRAAQAERRAGDYSTDSPQMSSLTGQSSEGTTAS